MQFLLSLLLWLSSFTLNPVNDGIPIQSTNDLQVTGRNSLQNVASDRFTRRNPRIVVNTEDVIYAPPH